MNPRPIIHLLWLIFIIYWWASSIGLKKYVPGSRKRGFLLRLLWVVVILLLCSSPASRHDWYLPRQFDNPAVVLSGIVLCVAGMAFAVWAKVCLGKNWGVPMSLRQGHELVTAGPYRIVRHPIYTGILLAQLGSWLASSPAWLFAFVMFLLYFGYSARVEERLMIQLFPGQYPDYQRQTRGMIFPR